MQSYNQINFNDIAPDELINYIVNKHHGFTKNMLSLTLQHSKTLSNQGEKEASYISKTLILLNETIKQHFKDEEEILYPYAKKLLEWKRTGNNTMVPSVNIIGNPINRFIEEHVYIIDLFNEIRTITNNYTVASNNKSQLKLLHAELFELEQDLQKQIYIENNILFTKLMELQKEMILAKPTN
jgi:regulator of cell morphogenesis and NO signaling